MSLSNAIAKVLAAALLKELPGELAEKFELEEDQVEEFLAGWLSKQLGAKSVKGKKKAGTGKKNAWMVFLNEYREEAKENGAKGGAEISKYVSALWQKLSEKKKAKYKAMADELNESNGLTAAPKKASKKKAAAPKKASKKKTVAKKDSKKKAAPKKASSSESSESSDEPQEMKVVRDKEHKIWLVKDTKLVLKSNRNKVVIGRQRGNKTIQLSAKDIALCKKNDWEVQKEEIKPSRKAAAKKSSKGSSKSSKASTSKAKPESESESDSVSGSESEPQSDDKDTPSDNDVTKKAAKLLVDSDSDSADSVQLEYL